MVRAESLEANSSERKDLLKEMRHEGRFEYNKKADSNFQVSRQPSKGKKKKVLDYAFCPKCKGTYVRKRLSEHLKKCAGIEKIKGIVNLNLLANCGKLKCHESASVETKKMFVHFRDNELTRFIVNDRLLVSWANLKSSKYRASKRTALLGSRANLRLIGKLFLEMKKIEPELQEFSNIFTTKHFSTMIKGVNALLEDSQSKNSYNNPYNSNTIQRCLKELIVAWKDMCNMDIDSNEGKEQEYVKLKEKCERFETSLQNQYLSLVGKVAYEAQNEISRQRIQKLPSKDDVSMFFKYATNVRNEAYHVLLKCGEFERDSWQTMLETSIITLIIFNRRRVGDLANLKIAHFNTRVTVKESNPDTYDALNKNDKFLADYFKHIFTDGKKSRTVPILLDPATEKCLCLLYKLREEANVSAQNPYIFGLPGMSLSSNEYKYPDPCTYIRKYSNLCGAKEPTLLRGTILRKHFATTVALLDVCNEELESIANFMGHDLSIHKNFYRLPQVSSQVTKISKLLLASTGINIEDEIDIDGKLTHIFTH